MELDKRCRSRALLLGVLLVAFFLAGQVPYVYVFLQFVIGLVGMTLLASYAMQTFSLAKWKQRLALKLIIIAALTWYIYPAVTWDSKYYDKVAASYPPVVDSYQELIQETNIIVIGQYDKWGADLPRHGHPYEPLLIRIITRTHKEPGIFWSLPLYYWFSVGEYIMGRGPDSLTISTRFLYGSNDDKNAWLEWSLEHLSSTPFPLAPTDMLTGSVVPTFIEPYPDDLVVIFLWRPQSGSYSNTWPSTEPYMFKLVDDTLYVQSNLPQVREAFPPITLTELMEMIGD